MSEFTQDDKDSLLKRLQKFLPSLQYSNQYTYGNPIDFADSCSCYSDWTTESCRLEVSVCGILPETDTEQWDLRYNLERETETWAQKNLYWNGCDCCGDNLSVWVRLFDVATEEKV